MDGQRNVLIRNYSHTSRRFELSLEQNCLLWGRKVVIPNQLRNRILQELHECGHLGITRMKALARSHFWWPKLDGSIETMARQCAACKQVKNTPPTTPLHTWQWATRPLQRVHMDYAEKDGEHFFFLVDAYSKWPECFPMGHNTTTSKTIDILRYCLLRMVCRRQWLATMDRSSCHMSSQCSWRTMESTTSVFLPIIQHQTAQLSGWYKK